MAFTDASKESYGTVLYLQNCETNEISFLLSKSRVIPNSNSNSIPVLELQALTFGVETAYSIKKELCNAFCPVNIMRVDIFTDFTIALNWLSAKTTKFSKI